MKLEVNNRMLLFTLRAPEKVNAYMSKKIYTRLYKTTVKL